MIRAYAPLDNMEETLEIQQDVKVYRLDTNKIKNVKDVIQVLKGLDIKVTLVNGGEPWMEPLRPYLQEEAGE